MEYLLGTDIGTSGTKTILMDTEGNLIAKHLVEYDVLTPRPLWAEQWPDVWLEAARSSIRETVLKSGIAKEDIKGLAVSGLYGGSGIPLDEEMRPVRPCLIWMDRRKATGYFPILGKKSFWRSPRTALTHTTATRRCSGSRTMSLKTGREQSFFFRQMIM